MWDKVKNYILYADTTRENYGQIKKKVEDSNRSMLLIFSSVAFVIILVMFVLALTINEFSKSRDVYLLGVIFSFVAFVIGLLSRKFPILVYVGMYAAISGFLFYGISIGTITRPEEQTVTFMVMMVLLPLIFVDRPIRMALILAIHIIMFIVAAYFTKPPEIFSVDMIDAIIYGLLAMVSAAIVARSKVRGFVLENKLQVLSEKDQLTGLNNRNSYEWRLPKYPGLINKRLGCVYIDVNGLHQLNNTKGHQAGDQMLKYIAGAVENQFGKSDSYRVGGDEFVAFAKDIDEDELISKLKSLTDDITGQKYTAAIGYDIQDKINLVMDQLIINAEKRMYDDKALYYSKHKQFKADSRDV